MGALHHAMMWTAAAAIGTPAAISGARKVGAQISRKNDEWTADTVMVSRSAWVLMEGCVRIPGDVF